MNVLNIQNRIVEIRGYKVMLDFDLAALYEVETRVLNQAVRRNIDLFPGDFMFQLTLEEWESMSSQFVMTYAQKRFCMISKYNLSSSGKERNYS